MSRTMWPSHFTTATHDDTLTARELRKVHETDIKIRSAGQEWKVLSYYYSSDDGCYVMDIEELNSTYEEGWNACIESFFGFGLGDKGVKRSDGNKAFKKGWDACKKCKNPDWI